MVSDIEIRQVTTRGELAAFVKLPWRVYQGDPNWVPPLISDQLEYLDPHKNSFFSHSDVVLYSAYRSGEIAGTIAAFVDHQMVERLAKPVGGFGFFEVIKDYEVARLLLNSACDWLRAKAIQSVSGPTSFTDNDNPGVLVEGADCPPVMMEAHTPLYYKDFLETYGMQKSYDLYAWRAFRSQIGDELKNIPPDLLRVAEAARKAARVNIRKIRMEQWEEEIETAVHLFNATLTHIPNFNPISLPDFQRLAGRMKPFIDPDLALFAEVDGKPIGFCVAIPDVNRVLIHLNGRLFPFNWMRIKRLIQRIDVVSFKLMGLLEEYRHRGIDAMLYLEAVKAFYEKGYAWLDGSVTSEYNPAVNLIANRLGAERYKHYRIYQLTL
jgi:GNAT superfamily N-acetyltransferase